MVFGKVYNWLMDNPRKTGVLAAIASTPLMVYTLQHYEASYNKWQQALTMLKVLSPGWSYLVFNYLTMFLSAFTRETPERQRTRFGDYKIIRDLESRLEKPTVVFDGVQNVGVRMKDVLSELRDDSPSGLQKLANSSENPATAIDAAIRYIEKGEFDESLLCIRDAFDYLKGKEPSLSAYFAGLDFVALGCLLNRKLFVRDMRVYMISAALAAVRRPKKAWYYSALGKKVADAFKTQYRKEMYVFDALLATAQHRSDEKISWNEAFKVLQESPQWQRVGESRSVVRVLKDSKFFSQTVIFKDSKSLRLLEKGASDYRTLAERVSEIVVPRSLYISSRPNSEGCYTLVMRLLPGKTLYNLEKSGKEIPLYAVVEKLAEIHARMPKELPEMKLAYKLRSKLLVKELGISHKQALNIVKNYRPVYNAIRENAVWVYNKDAHLENWLDCNGKLGVIDCEAEYLVPAHYDLANVFGLDDDISLLRLGPYMNKYLDKAKLEGLPVNPVTFVRGFYNSYIDRMLSFSSAWSSPSRPGLHGERKAAMSRAVRAIDIIRLVDSEYYEANKQSYDALQLELLNISAQL